MTRFTCGGRDGFPVVLHISPEHTGATEKAIPLTLREARRLRTEIGNAIEWGVNIEDLRKEKHIGEKQAGNMIEKWNEN